MKTIIIAMILCLTISPCFGEVLINKGYGAYTKLYHIDFDITKPALDEIRKMEGVETATNNHRYRVYITIGKLFKWSDVEPKVLEVLRGGEVLTNKADSITLKQFDTTQLLLEFAKPH